jgi:hypothetical protein
MFGETLVIDRSLPMFYDQLTAEDQVKYHSVRAVVGRPENRYNRCHRLSTLRSSFDEIRKFCVRGDELDGVRCLVCGICWLDRDEIGINTRQLRLMIAKSKSSINGAFAKMGYSSRPSKEREIERLCRALPLLSAFPTELRKWTIRVPIDQPPSDGSPVQAEVGGDRSWDLDTINASFHLDVARMWGTPGELDVLPKEWYPSETQERLSFERWREATF